MSARRSPGDTARWLLGVGVLAFIAAAYWPVADAGFLWDDKSTFHDAAWLRQGQEWLHYMRSGIVGWINYFRPLVVALFTLEVRAFDVTPAPMHLVSLAMHLFNTLLVGLLALQLLRRGGLESGARRHCVVAMLFYGLHPALIEPIVWISAQGELVLTGLTLLALLFNCSAIRPVPRALAVGLCFLCAALTKESAIALPPLLLVLDFVLIDAGARGQGLAAGVRAILRRQRWTYAAVLAAGLLYLALRYWALGYLLRPAVESHLSLFARMQAASLTYLEYWRICLWPMWGMGPLHPVDAQRFLGVSAGSLAVDALALAIVALALQRFFTRRPFGVPMVAVSVALFPVLNALPIAFVESLYHERYAMTAIAVACALAPYSVAEWRRDRKRAPGPILAAILLLAAVWLGMAVVNIRATVPLWSDEVALWQWALRQNPGSVTARDHLLSTYIERNDHAQARALADSLFQENVRCANCLLNIAYLALSEQNGSRAAAALKKLRDSGAPAFDPHLLHGYTLAMGELLELQGKPDDAADAYRDAISTDPLDPAPHMKLALLLARAGNLSEARRAADTALSLSAPDQRQEFLKAFGEYLPGHVR